MKKVLHSFLSRVTSRISLVMLTILPATGGTRRKSRILAKQGQRKGSLPSKPDFQWPWWKPGSHVHLPQSNPAVALSARTVRMW